MRSVHLQKDKTIFDVSQLPGEAFARSMGLAGAPQISFGNEKDSKRKNGLYEKFLADEEEDIDEEADNDHESDNDAEPIRKDVKPVRTKHDRMFERRNQSILAPHFTSMVQHDADRGLDDDDVFTLSRRNHDLEDGIEQEPAEFEESPREEPSAVKSLVSSGDLSRRKLKQASTRKGQIRLRSGPSKLLFTDEGDAREIYQSGIAAEKQATAARDAYFTKERESMLVAHKEDKQVAREKRMEKKRKRKDRERDERQDVGDAVIGSSLHHEQDDVAFDPADRGQADSRSSKRPHDARASAGDSFLAEEALALRLLEA